jgi:hypothetical protein
MAEEQSPFSVGMSALFATLLLCVASLLAINKFSVWGRLGAGEMFWTIFALLYAIVLTLSGWLYGGVKKRAIGLMHATLMIGVAGLFLYEGIAAVADRPKAGNPVAGFVAAVDLACIVIGLLAAICGIAVMVHLYPAKPNPPPQKWNERL